MDERTPAARRAALLAELDEATERARQDWTQRLARGRSEISLLEFDVAFRKGVLATLTAIETGLTAELQELQRELSERTGGND
jgi:hypothetical protein